MTDGSDLAQYGPDGPIMAARTWLQAMLVDHDYARVWSLSDPIFRLARAQAWVHNNQHFADVASWDRDELATALAESPSQHPLWADFAATELEQFCTTWAHWEPSTMGASTEPRLLSPDHELVVFAETGGEVLRFDEPTEVFGLGLVVHLTGDGWLVAGQDRVPVPGWPPQF